MAVSIVPPFLLRRAVAQPLARWAEELGFSVETDPIGNLFIHRPGTDETLPPVMAGSHLDTQPTGGKFDGAFGVLAAFEALQAIHEAGIATRHPIEVVSWTNEEGSRFQPGCSGSSAFTGAVPLEQHLEAVDRDGITARDALAAVLSTERGMPMRPWASRSPLSSNAISSRGRNWRRPAYRSAS